MSLQERAAIAPQPAVATRELAVVFRQKVEAALGGLKCINVLANMDSNTNCR